MWQPGRYGDKSGRRRMQMGREPHTHSLYEGLASFGFINRVHILAPVLGALFLRMSNDFGKDFNLS